MGVFSFLFKKKREEADPTINVALKSSFSNVKNDVLHLHKMISSHTDHTNNKFEELNERVKRIELLLQNQQPQKIINIVKHKEEPKEEQLMNELDAEQTTNLLKGIPRAELRLFQALYQLQASLNAKHISYKSLASYLYPGKDYNSIRSTITQFVLRLYSEGLVEKQRIGKESYVKITPNGHKVLKDSKMKKIIKEAEATNN